MGSDEKVLYRGWLPVEDEVDDTGDDVSRLRLEAVEALKMVVKTTQVSLSEMLSGIISDLQALAIAQQSAHWRSLGTSFYGDHLMYQRMYDATIKEIDRAAEKMLGMTGDETLLDPHRLSSSACMSLKTLLPAPGDVVGALLIAEKKFLSRVYVACAAAQHIGTAGVDNMLQGIADQHEEHVYLLSRRASDQAV